MIAVYTQQTASNKHIQAELFQLINTDCIDFVMQ